MTPPTNLADLIPDIDLRWTLRDIRAERFLLLPPDPAHVQELLNRGLIEMRGDKPVLTEAGLDALDVY